MAAKKKDTRSATPAQKKAMAAKRSESTGFNRSSKGFGETATGRYEKTVRGAIEATGKKIPKSWGRRVGNELLSKQGVFSSPSGQKGVKTRNAIKGLTPTQAKAVQQIVDTAMKQKKFDLGTPKKKK